MRGECSLEISINVWTAETEQFSWFVVDESDEGREIGELVKGITLPLTPSANSAVTIGVWYTDKTGYEYYQFALSDEYSIEEIKQYFNAEMSK